MRRETGFFISVVLAIISAALTLLCILVKASALQIMNSGLLAIICGWCAYTWYWAW